MHTASSVQKRPLSSVFAGLVADHLTLQGWGRRVLGRAAEIADQGENQGQAGESGDDPRCTACPGDACAWAGCGN